MTKFRKYAAGDKLRPGASQVNAWTSAAVENEKRKSLGTQNTKPQHLIVETIGDHDKGATQACAILTGPKGSETATENEMECYNRFVDLLDGTRCIAEFIINGWEIIQAECEPTGGE